jgi:hypothetical protein
VSRPYHSDAQPAAAGGRIRRAGRRQRGELRGDGNQTAVKGKNKFTVVQGLAVELNLEKVRYRLTANGGR